MDDIADIIKDLLGLGDEATAVVVTLALLEALEEADHASVLVEEWQDADGAEGVVLTVVLHDEKHGSPNGAPSISPVNVSKELH